MTQVLLTIAGTDPSGAAGIQVDLQVFRDHDFHGASAITALLAQNTVGVRSIRALDPSEVVEQIRAVTDDLRVAGVKVGLVPTAAIVEAIVANLPPGVPVVWDPVLSSGDGAVELTAPGTLEALREALDVVDVFTPNVPEAASLTGARIATRSDAHAAAQALVELGADGVLLKVGHLDHAGDMRDVWADASGARDLEPLPAIDADVRGTGCQLSSAICAGLASGSMPVEAAEAARRYLSELLRSRAVAIGEGRRVVVR